MASFRRYIETRIGRVGVTHLPGKQIRTKGHHIQFLLAMPIRKPPDS